MSTDGGVFVDAEEKCIRLSTEMVPGVDVRCLQVALVHGWGCFCGRGREMQSPVHGEGAWRGRTVPGGDFCPRTGAFLWTRKRNVAACPRRWCLAWTHGARRWHLSTQMVPGVDVRCLEVTFVHGWGHFCGRTVPGGTNVISE